MVFHRGKKGKLYARFSTHISSNTRMGAGIPSILTISLPPPQRDKILYNPRYFPDRFRDFVSESKRLPLRVFMKQWRKRACTRVHMFEVCSLRNEREGEMVWEMVELCDILQGPILFSPLCAHPRVPAPLEKLSLHRREELFRLWNNWLFFSFFFVFFPRMKMTIYRVHISVITRWLHAKLLLHLAFNGRERKNCNNSESLSETDGSEN